VRRYPAARVHLTLEELLRRGIRRRDPGKGPSSIRPSLAGACSRRTVSWWPVRIMASSLSTCEPNNDCSLERGDLCSWRKKEFEMIGWAKYNLGDHRGRFDTLHARLTVELLTGR
jgi:hypothetical protein